MPVTTDRLLQEDGSSLVLQEDAASAILLEEAAAGASNERSFPTNSVREFPIDYRTRGFPRV